jgi:hypothetical protein
MAIQAAMNSPAPTWIISVLFLGLAAFILYPSPWLLWEGNRSKEWPHAVGVIHSTKIIERARSSKFGDGSWHIPIIVYYYQVGAIDYTNSRVVFASYRPNFGYGNQAEAEAIVNRYPAGKQVTVYYEPSNPGDSVLEPGIQNSVLNNDGIAVGLVTFALLLPMLRQRGPNTAMEPAATSPVGSAREKKFGCRFCLFKSLAVTVAQIQIISLFYRFTGDKKTPPENSSGVGLENGW